MTSLDRIIATVGFEETDRVPVIPQVFGHAAVVSGVPLDAYVQDGDAIAAMPVKALERYGYDAVFTVMDVNVETEAVGSRLMYRAGQYPMVGRYAFTKESAWDAFPVPDPLRAGRMPEMLKALGILREGRRRRIPDCGLRYGPPYAHEPVARARDNALPGDR